MCQLNQNTQAIIEKKMFLVDILGCSNFGENDLINEREICLGGAAFNRNQISMPPYSNSYITGD